MTAPEKAPRRPPRTDGLHPDDAWGDSHGLRDSGAGRLTALTGVRPTAVLAEVFHLRPGRPSCGGSDRGIETRFSPSTIGARYRHRHEAIPAW